MGVASFNHGPKETPMTDTSMTLIELLQKHDEGDFLRAVTEAVSDDIRNWTGALPRMKGD